MNPKRNTKPEPKIKDHTDHFSDLRTIPSGWDLSELSELNHPIEEPGTSENRVDPQTKLPAVDL